MTGSLEGRVAVVTGGARGIGLAITETLADAGALVAVGSRGGETPEAAAHGGVLDLCDTASVAGFVGEVEALLGPVSILVNNAGIGVHSTVEDHDEAEWMGVIDTNLNGPFRMIRAVIGGMKAREHGRIVNIASTAARTATETHAAYCASKSGLLGLSRAVAVEGAPHGVTSVTVSPTWVETDMLRESAATMAAAAGRTVAEEIAELAQANPQGRLVQPKEIAALVAFLCSDSAPALTMEDIQVNAGAHW